MRRRDFVGSMGVLAAAAGAAAPGLGRAQVGVRAKITDVRVRRVKLVRELGQLDNTDFIVGMRPRYRVGGMTITEIITDQGVTGIGPGVDPAAAETAKAYLAGRDAFDIARHARALQSRPGGRAGASLDIALWDLIGKLAQQPLYKLWGGAKDQVRPYASFMTTGQPAERARLAAQLKAEGWTGCKLRTSFPTMKQDIAVVEAVRKACGDDFDILVDANKAYANMPNRHLWDVRRATETALAFQALGVYWLEEPLPQYDLKRLAELNQKLEMPLAGAENTTVFHDFVAQVEARAYDILNCEPALIGATMTRQVQSFAEPHGVPVVPHFGDGLLATLCQLHLVASWTTADTAEIINEPPVADAAAQWSIFESAPTLGKDGFMAMPQAPGLGVTIKGDLFEA